MWSPSKGSLSPLGDRAPRETWPRSAAKLRGDSAARSDLAGDPGLSGRAESAGDGAGVCDGLDSRGGWDQLPYYAQEGGKEEVKEVAEDGGCLSKDGDATYWPHSRVFWISPQL